SYPTAVEFHEGYGAGDYGRHLDAADASPDEPLSLYLHLPFCHKRCDFCGCNVVIAREHSISHRYLEMLHREIALVAGRLPSRRRVSQLHWGGGTPTYQNVDEMRRLHGVVREHFRLDDGAEIAIEVDPRVTSRAQLEALDEMGFNRISLGVQDVEASVQEAIGRNQSERQTRDLFTDCREIGFESVNLDLVYGLPRQTVQSFERTLDAILDLRPDRVALYSYAHLPSMRPNQKRIDESELPDAEVKLALMAGAMDRFAGAGYAQIGMDHFALPDDELTRAQSERTLHRNFMGYTVKMGGDMIGFGISAIGDVAGSFAQNTKKLNRYYDALENDRFPIERGYLLDDDDKLRRDVILDLMCNFHVDFREIERKHGITFDEYFAVELDELFAEDAHASHGFIERRPEGLAVVGPGQLFVRNVAMVFDRHLRTRRGPQPLFSRTV
ncbi:MAG: oxygen-independent coproporphyrinogen III oxidase, partial [Gammaproteobacteria bacterium]|nr:oxygen-independent coproporphyrinogen III oxidase [Gammaproteobacteria bacterium]